MSVREDAISMCTKLVMQDEKDINSCNAGCGREDVRNEVGEELILAKDKRESSTAK